MKLLHITCKEATFLIVKSEEHSISLIQNLKLALHLLICRFCRLFLKQNRWLTAALQKLETESSLTPAEKEKIKNAVHNSENKTN